MLVVLWHFRSLLRGEKYNHRSLSFFLRSCRSLLNIHVHLLTLCLNLNTTRHLVMSMQAACLDGLGGEKHVEPSLQETTLIQQMFGGRLKSKVT